jgi:alanine-glyoxylate transaminase/serine-glyoxylate transaminase/serine-pyruvate transaminase
MFRSVPRALAAYHGHHHRLYNRRPQAAACSSRIRGLWSSSSSSSSSPASRDRLSYEIVPKEDFGEFQEFSVIFTNRALNLMSNPFQRVMRDLNTLLKETYKADKVAIIPG